MKVGKRTIAGNGAEPLAEHPPELLVTTDDVTVGDGLGEGGFCVSVGDEVTVGGGSVGAIASVIRSAKGCEVALRNPKTGPPSVLQNVTPS